MITDREKYLIVWAANKLKRLVKKGAGKFC